MDIAVIGAGRVGSTLGRGLARAGHSIHYARRDPATPTPDRLVHDGASTGSPEEVVARSEVVLLATPWGAAQAAVSGLDFGGRPLFDVTNPIDQIATMPHVTGRSAKNTSGAILIAVAKTLAPHAKTPLLYHRLYHPAQ